MARSVLLSDLLSRLNQITDTENDTHLSTQEKYGILVSAICEVWDLLTESGQADQYVKKVSFTTTPGTVEYTFASVCTDGDFYKVQALYVDEGNGHRRPVQRVNVSEIYPYKAPQSAVTLELHYIPCAPTFGGIGNYNGALSWDGYNGWEELVLQIAAVTIKKKKEDDYRPFQERAMELKKRIQSMSNTDWNEPPRVQRRRRVRNDPYLPFRNDVTAYAVRGGKIEIYYNYGSYWV